MSQQSESTEKNKIDMQAKLDFEILLKENKHKQLLDSINLIQK